MNTNITTSVALDRSSIKGKIVLDNIDISRITVRQLRSNLDVIPQQPVLFSGALRYHPDSFNYYSDEQLWTVLEAVQIKPIIAKSSNNLLSSVFQWGANFSSGQRQLTCVARVILTECRILLTDVATNDHLLLLNDELVVDYDSSSKIRSRLQ
ncbi:unnamed protein product [Rotaria socialis]|uniref:ABC transporter domain-containing protein n=1 Tax=Rotaria socialis TaxID=392032 RepID=A0A817KI14_9BILA|nr:unnamed protein product [Rotaria socialis]CAF3307106.1 unnamed protein product [Rotaria socialis]CAF4471945.1 unnamed protein product [Rotaria socialis]CAF4505157.1 unnamed protein product [Rotaria socialis]CAF4575650.1 unnamed protein product [Rotaria socialis]